MFIDQSLFADESPVEVPVGELRRLQYLLGTGTYMPIMFPEFNKSMTVLDAALGGNDEVESTDRVKGDGAEG